MKKLDFSDKQTRVSAFIIIALIILVPLSRILLNDTPRTPKAEPDISDDDSFTRLTNGYYDLTAEQQETLLNYLETLLSPKEYDFASVSDDTVSWEDAGDYIGQTITVEGLIVKSYNSGNACFLNFHENYSDYFTAVIFKSAFSLFPDNPEDYFMAKKVQVTGTVKEYQGAPEIIIEGPSQISIVE